MYVRAPKHTDAKLPEMLKVLLNRTIWMSAPAPHFDIGARKQDSQRLNSQIEFLCSCDVSTIKSQINSVFPGLTKSTASLTLVTGGLL